ARQAEPGRRRRYLREILELEPSHAQAAAMLGEAPQAEAAGGSDEEIDVDEVEELSDGDFEVADSSGKIDLSEEVGTVNQRRPILAHGGSYESSEIPVEEADPEDDLIPLVVDPI